MKIHITAATAANQPMAGAALFMAENQGAKGQPKALENLLTQLAKRKQFTGKEGQTLLLQGWGKTKADQILLVGLGKYDQITAPKLTRASATAARSLQKARADRLAFHVPDTTLSCEATAKALTEGAIHGLYSFDELKTPDKENLKTKVKEILLCVKDKKLTGEADRGAKHGSIIGEAVNFARHLANQPGNLIYPETFAEAAQKLADEVGLQCTVFDRPALEEKKMGGLLAVGQGSNREPRLITLEYNPTHPLSPRPAPLALVGKAITFDTGGISLKPGKGMEEMKWDKCGGCAVLGTMRAIAKLKPPFSVIAVIASAENMPSSTSYRPGDIIRTFSGKTVEILNTDAEGRVILSDALAWANTFKPRAMVDFATLTGAVGGALGTSNSGLFGNNDNLIGQVKVAGELSGDTVWHLPLTDFDRESIKGSYSDIVNTSNDPGNAGASKGAAFLERFVDKTPWAHLDIASTAWHTDEKPHAAKGATGVGVRLVMELLGRL